MADDKNQPRIVLNASEECVAGLDARLRGKSKPDFTVTAVTCEFGDRGFVLGWETQTTGYGEITIWEEDGMVICDNEAMSPRFVKEVFCKWVDSMHMTESACPEHGKMFCQPCAEKDKT